MKTKKLNYLVFSPITGPFQVSGYAVDYPTRFCVHKDFDTWRCDDWVTGCGFKVYGRRTMKEAIEVGIIVIEQKLASGEWLPAQKKALKRIAGFKK